ncbi:MAG TPA: EthD family reductase, partial [Burkholderiales bacterium]|nr:EthD family reductase [Burkholderiales bacterium]
MAWTADSRWLGLLAEYLIKSTTVLSLALLISTLLRRKSAALRHFVLCAFLVGLVLLPLLPSLPAGWEIRWLPAWLAAPGTAPGSRPGAPAGELAEQWLSSPPLITTEPLTARPSSDIPPALRTADQGTPLRDSSKTPAAIFPVLRIARTFIPVAWAAGLLVLLLRLGLGLAGAARLSREGRPLADSAWEMLLRRFLAFVIIRRRVRLKSHGRVAVPMTWGIVRPVVLFPEESRDWDEGRRSAALFHELSHIKRADFAVMLLVRLSLALYWFNPLIWAAFRRLRREQEKACDELVLRAGIKPSAYARSLLLFRRPAIGAWGPSAALLGMSAGASLDDRLAAILKQKISFKEITMRTRIILTIAVFSVVSLVGSARPAAQAAAAPAAGVAAAAAPAATPVPAQEVSVDVKLDKQEAEKEQKAEQAEKKSKEKGIVTKTIVITTSEAKKGQLQITVSEGNETKTWVVDHPLIVEGAGVGQDITLKVDGKDYRIPQGEQLTLIFGDSTGKASKEGKAGELVVGVPGVIKLDTPGHQSTVIRVVSPEGVIVKEIPGTVAIKEAPRPVIIKEVVVAPAVVAEVPAPPAPPAAPAGPQAIVTVIYNWPKDTTAFEKYYAATHLPLVTANQAEIGFVRADLTKFARNLDGTKPAYYRQAELYFKSMAD